MNKCSTSVHSGTGLRPNPSVCSLQTEEASSTEGSSSLLFSADVSQAFKVYATVGEEAVAYERHIAEAHYDAEYERLQAELRERHRRAFQHERERVFAQVERLRGKTLAGLREAA